MTHDEYIKRRDEKISSALHQIRTRSLRDAPVYLNHVSMAEMEMKQAIDELVLAVIGEDEKEFKQWTYEQHRNMLRDEVRSIVKGGE
jgi:hypothetical protein